MTKQAVIELNIIMCAKALVLFTVAYREGAGAPGADQIGVPKLI